jgi:uncharacterized membrane protein
MAMFVCVGFPLVLGVAIVDQCFHRLFGRYCVFFVNKSYWI